MQCVKFGIDTQPRFYFRVIQHIEHIKDVYRALIILEDMIHMNIS